MPEVIVATGWRVVGGCNEMAVALDYPGAWSDATGQPDAEIPTDPNVFFAHGTITEVQLAALLADERYTVLQNQGALEAESILDNPAANDLKNKLKQRHGLKQRDADDIVQVGEKRGQTCGRAKAWGKGLKKQKGQMEE